MFTFLSAMFVIVVSDNLEWLFTGWEITTVCSFLMIGYTRTPEAIKNSFTQINLNMVGGLAFLAALILVHAAGLPMSLTSLIAAGKGIQADLLIVPLMLLSVAGLTKACLLYTSRCV